MAVRIGQKDAKSAQALCVLVVLVLIWGGLLSGARAEDGPPVCLYVSSYHVGYHWNDAIEQGLEDSLDEACRLERFYMDTKRHQGAAFAATKGKEAFDLIDRLAPDVVIACDDNASKYLVQPYLKDAAVPVVFCGVNWTVDAYGYPYSNVTGMVEVAPNREVVREAKAALGDIRSFAFVTADVPTQHKEVQRLSLIAAREGLALQPFLARSMQAWTEAFKAAQSHDFVVLGNPVGIPDWDRETAKHLVEEETRVLTATFGVYMRPFVVFAMSNVPEEQGEWAGQVAVSILKGRSPSEIPIVANQRWRLHVNPNLAAKLGFSLPERILRRAVRVE